MTSAAGQRIVAWLRSSSARTFVLYPLLVVAWELTLNRGHLRLEWPYLSVMAWGYTQYRLCGKYRIARGGGGPGMKNPPVRLVTTGPYGYTRNPMYLGHLVYLIGLGLSLRSLFAAVLTVATAVWFHFRVLRDEAGLVRRFGEAYAAYRGTVKRWIPGLF